MVAIHTLIALAATMVSTGLASPVDASPELETRGNTWDSLGSCWENGCEPTYNPSFYTVGICTAGKYQGASCYKCWGRIPNCRDSGCNGLWTCTDGDLEGCPCQ